MHADRGLVRFAEVNRASMWLIFLGRAQGSSASIGLQQRFHLYVALCCRGPATGRPRLPIIFHCSRSFWQPSAMLQGACKSQMRLTAVTLALAVAFSLAPATQAASVAVPPELAPSTSSNVTATNMTVPATNMTVPATNASAPSAAAPAAAAEAPAGTAANPFGDTGFITVQGNKFVDANCQVRRS